MNKRQKLVQQQFLDNEEGIINTLRTAHETSFRDIAKKVEKLQNEFDELTAIYDTVEDDVQRETLKSMQRSKVYQLKYQKALQKEVGDVLGKLHAKDFKSVSEYLDGCYTDGFIGAMYDLQGQGLPFIFPIDQEAMVRAVQLDSKISQGLYKRLGEDVALLKKKITAQVSRGISTGMTYDQMAKSLSSITNIGFNNASRIARTEGHRIQVQSGMDACYKAKEKGADVVKQWDSTLDSRTRKSHKRCDGEIRELDEEFSNGLMFPGDPDGKAEEVIHCRCALLQRSRAALDESELETLQKRAKEFGLDKTDNFNDFKKKYLKAAESVTDDLTKSAKKNKISFESIKLSGIDADYAPDIEETFTGLMDEYPVEGLHVKTNRASTEFGHFQGGIKGTKKNGEQYAVLENEICISKSSYKDKATSEAEHLYNYKDRESALQNAARLDLATVPHEYAHAIDHAYVLAKEPELKAFADRYKTPRKVTAKDISEINDFNVKVNKSNSRLSKEIFDELQKEYGLDYMGTIMRIDAEYGHYASSSISEFLAEAFANMQMLEDANKTDFMKSFERIFKRKFKEVLGG